ncbi:hypothetical protein CEXT_416521 [Caerostris extrusa]|uniref:Uncharacterized protein n=1 Tax=Caerostris extrusa TaxID=172846 RepID=A0AAV4YA79_CAEEX|nr:hypothetical protein CEXT_416521 [Caerostris extrusa]
MDPNSRRVSPITLQGGGGMLISPFGKFHGVVETVPGTSRWKENSCCLCVLLFGCGFPRTKDMQMPEIFHERGCSNESSYVTAAVAKRVSNREGVRL